MEARGGRLDRPERAHAEACLSLLESCMHVNVNEGLAVIMHSLLKIPLRVMI